MGRYKKHNSIHFLRFAAARIVDGLAICGGCFLLETAKNNDLNTALKYCFFEQILNLLNDIMIILNNTFST